MNGGGAGADAKLMGGTISEDVPGELWGSEFSAVGAFDDGATMASF
jgi:hypothetical protein